LHSQDGFARILAYVRSFRTFNSKIIYLKWGGGVYYLPWALFAHDCNTYTNVVTLNSSIL